LALSVSSPWRTLVWHLREREPEDRDGLVAAEREGVKYVRTAANDTTVDNLLQGQGLLAAAAWEED
jgi:hypothetical protein